MQIRRIGQSRYGRQGTRGFKATAVLLLAVFLVSGCSSVGVYSDPSGAKVFINDKDTRRMTPVLLGVRRFSRGRSYITVEKEGYETVTKRQAVDVRTATGNVIFSWWPPVLLVNLFGDQWKKIIAPHRGRLKEFELEKITDQE